MEPLKPFAKILVPTDFSQGAKDAFERALELRRLYGGTVTLMHVYQLPVGPSSLVDLPDFTASLERAAFSEMAKLKEHAHLEGPVTIATQVTLGVPYKAIIHAAREGSYDLIVMGTHGRSGIKHLFIGSVAERVVRSAPCPVLTVPEPTKQR